MFPFRRKKESSVTPRGLVIALGIASLGALGLVPPSNGDGPSVMSLIGWLAVLAPAAGCLAASLRLGLWPLGLVPPAVWMALVGVVDASSLRGLPTPAWSGVAWTGLYVVGWAIGSFGRPRPFAASGVLLLVAGSLAALPTGGGIVSRPWPHGVTALLLDLSPVTLVVECAGIDWMRHPAIYEAAGDIPPDVRHAYRGILAGPIVLLVGLIPALIGELRSRAAARRSPAVA